jgi:hypothetical protein
MPSLSGLRPLQQISRARQCGGGYSGVHWALRPYPPHSPRRRPAAHLRPTSPLILELLRRKELKRYIHQQEDAHTLRVDPSRRGHIKQALVNIGYPAEDLAGYVTGDLVTFDRASAHHMGASRLPCAITSKKPGGLLRRSGAAHGGSGVIVLPCGAGKTIVGLSVMNEMQCSTLILTPNTVSVRQWIDELLDKTTLTPEHGGRIFRPAQRNTPDHHLHLPDDDLPQARHR